MASLGDVVNAAKRDAASAKSRKLSPRVEQYAGDLFAAEADRIKKEHIQRVAAITMDYSKRGLSRSSMHIRDCSIAACDRTRELVKALITARLDAIERAGVRVDDAALQGVEQKATELIQQERIKVEADIRAMSKEYRISSIREQFVTGVGRRFREVSEEMRRNVRMRAAEANFKKEEPGAKPVKDPAPQRGAANRKRSPPRRPSELKRPLTPKQVEAYNLVLEHKGNISAAAMVLGVDRSTVGQHYKAALKKLGKEAVKLPKTKRMPLDRRQQVNLDMRSGGMQRGTEDTPESVDEPL